MGVVRLRVGDLEMDLIERTVRREGELIDLLPKEFQLLEYFMRRPGQIVTRAMLFEDVWNSHSPSYTNIMDVQMGNLRRKLDPIIRQSDRPPRPRANSSSAAGRVAALDDHEHLGERPLVAQEPRGWAQSRKGGLAALPLALGLGLAVPLAAHADTSSPGTPMGSSSGANGSNSTTTPSGATRGAQLNRNKGGCAKIGCVDNRGD
jgi:hypothetical protein